MMIGHPGVAAIMAPTSRIGLRISPNRAIVCSTCFYEQDEGALANLLQIIIAEAMRQRASAPE